MRAKRDKIEASFHPVKGKKWMSERAFFTIFEGVRQIEFYREIGERYKGRYKKRR